MRWVTVNVAADASKFSRWTLYRWARAGYIVAKRLAKRHGPWLLKVDGDGNPVDAE